MPEPSATTVLVVASDVHRAHHGLELADGRIGPSEEGPERADLIIDRLRADGHDVVAPDPVDLDLLRRVHTAEYVDFLATAWDRWTERGDPAAAAMGFTWPTRGMTASRPTDLVGQLGYHSFAADCSITDGTWAAATEAAAIAVTATDQMLACGVTTYGLCRPPGHHATADQFGGYCYLNNAAVAAQHLLDGGAVRVAILDVDYHHGNGTQSIFYARNDVLFVSLHADPTVEFPWFCGHADETGRGTGTGWNLNLPLAEGTSIAAYTEALDAALARIAEADVDALVVSLGVDTFVNDPLGTFTLTTPDFTTIGRAIATAARPTVVLQEGGYATADLGSNVSTFLDGMTVDPDATVTDFVDRK